MLECNVTEHLKRAMNNSSREIVTIVFSNGSMKHVDVTADSCIAIMHDVYKALC